MLIFRYAQKKEDGSIHLECRICGHQDKDWIVSPFVMNKLFFHHELLYHFLFVLGLQEPLS